ncbi:MAG: alpha/beta hydrolase [Tissierellia bacterium]|nr:alpha/beta hydrolase [Tissierellia bacterium]
MQIIIDDNLINYYESLNGKENFIILHGWGAMIQTVMPIINHLKNIGNVYALDLPGFGKSSEPKEVWDSYKYAEIVEKFIAKKKIDNPILIGHSFGGKICAIMASSPQNNVKKLVLIDASGIKPKRKLDYYIKVYTFKLMKKFYTLFNRDKKSLDNFYKKYGSDDYKAADGIMRKILVGVVNEDIKPILKDIKAKTLIFWGSDDDATPLYMADEFHVGIKNSILKIVDGGHYSYLDHPNKFRETLDSFLDMEE